MAPEDLDNILAATPSLSLIWQQAESEAVSAATIGRPRSHTYSHMDHGPAHWTVVRTCAEKLWANACETHPTWANPEAILLVKLASLLHDIGMIYGYDLITLPDAYKKLLIDYGGHGVLDSTQANTPQGQFILRQLQAEIGEAVVLDWTLGNKPFATLPPHLRSQLIHVLNNYSKIPPKDLADPATEQERSQTRAICLVLCFSDWHHLDHTRTDPAALLHAQDEFVRLAKLWKSNSSPVPPHGAEAFLIPKLLRCYYVRDRVLECPPGSNTVRFSLHVARPPLVKGPTRAALSQLQAEWREKFYPSRLAGPVLADLLRETCGLAIDYNEPTMQEHLGSSLHPLPPIAKDFWIAAQWFAMDDQSHFMTDYEAYGPTLDHAITFTYRPQELFRRYSKDHHLEVGRKPVLRRPAFLAIHLRITFGISWISLDLFPLLHSEIACTHPDVPGTREKLFLKTLERAAKQTRLKLWSDWTNSVSTKVRGAVDSPSVGATLTALAEDFFEAYRSDRAMSLYPEPQIPRTGFVRKQRVAQSTTLREYDEIIEACAALGALSRVSRQGRDYLELRSDSLGGSAMLLWANTNPMGMRLTD